MIKISNLNMNNVDIVQDPSGKEVMVKRIAYDIQWDVDMDEVYEKLDEMTVTCAAEAIKVPAEKYANMTTSERHDWAYGRFRHFPGLLYDFVGLPDEVIIPDNVENDEGSIETADWLSDTYGYCIEGFKIKAVIDDVSIKCNGGTMKAYVCNDGCACQAGILYVPDGDTVEIDLCLAEVKGPELSKKPNNMDIDLYVYDDPYQEDYTICTKIEKEDITKALQDT